MKQTIRNPRKELDAEGDDRRQCKRVSLSYPIRVSGCDSTGHSFSDVTVTTDVSDSGCRFDLLREIEMGEVVTIQIVDRNTGKPHDGRAPRFRVAWATPSDRGWSVGVVLLEPENFWHMIFPKRNGAPKSSR
jgi:hypothetical protein